MTGVSEAQGAEPLGQHWMGGTASRSGHMDHLTGSLTLQCFPFRLTLNSKLRVELQWSQSLDVLNGSGMIQV